MPEKTATTEPSTALVPVDSSLQPGTLAELQTFAREFSVSQLLPKHLRDKPADVAITVLYGRELGLTPMQAIQGIHVIEGKPSLSAAMAVALVKRSPLCEFFDLVDSSAKSATYETKRRGGRKESKMTFTIEEAQSAGLLGKDNWKKYPAAMLRNRAALALARDVYPDVVANIISDDEADDLRPSFGHVAPPPPTAAAAAPQAKGWTPPASTIEATATPAQTLPQILAAKIAAADTVAALELLAPALAELADADKPALREAYKARKKALALPADGKPAPGWDDANRMPKPDPQAGEAPRGQVTREGGRVSTGDAKTGGPAESAKWGEIIEAGATTVGEREVGADDE